MRIRLCIALLWTARFAPAQSAKCVPVEGDQILARDLAMIVPVFDAIPPQTPIGLTPAPAVRRVFRSFEVESLAKRYSLPFETTSDICFERPMATLERGRVVEAMRVALAIPDANIEIVEISQFPIPRGHLEFRRERLGLPALPSSRTPVTWRGEVIYGEKHRFNVWARVVLTSQVRYMVAAGNLKSGEPITASQVREESSERFPLPGDLAQSADQVVGRLPLRDIQEGKEIHLPLLTLPLDVIRGEMVEVEVVSGATRLAFTGKAESSGRTGDTIAIRNPASSRIFQARVNGKGKALLQANTLQRN
jgi:flagella basal body P-ring formation protein FlgA